MKERTTSPPHKTGELYQKLAQGIGIGLSNSKRVADEFDIQSELGKFTRVTCTFKLRSDGTPAAEQENPA